MSWLSRRMPRSKNYTGYEQPKELLSKIFVLNDIHIKSGVDGNPSAPGAIAEALNRYYYSTPNNIRNLVDIVNQEQPDHVFILGDICDKPSDFALFWDIWQHVTVPTTITTGNHDYDDTTYNELIDIFNRADQPTIAHSKFNQTFELNGVRHIVLDTTFDANGLIGNHFNDIHVHPETFTWIENTLLNCDENMVMIHSHVGFHGHHFNPGQRSTMTQLLSGILALKPNMKIQSFFGHDHKEEVTIYNNMSANRGYLLPAMILFEQGRFTEIDIYNNGIDAIKRTVEYERS